MVRLRIRRKKPLPLSTEEWAEALSITVKQVEDLAESMARVAKALTLTADQLTQAFQTIAKIGSYIEEEALLPALGTLDIPYAVVDTPPLGFRTWHIICTTNEGWRLKSTMASLLWDGPVQHMKGEICVADARPRSGFYSLYPSADVLSTYSGARGDYIVGLVSHFGTVIECELGWRSTMMRIDALVVKDDPLVTYNAGEMMLDLQKVYQCPVHIQREKSLAEIFHPYLESAYGVNRRTS